MNKLLIAAAMFALSLGTAAAATEDIRACGEGEKGTEAVISVMFDGNKVPLTRLANHGQFEPMGNAYLFTYNDGLKTNLLAVSVEPPRLLSREEAAILADEAGTEIRDLVWAPCQ